jgi:hypothetical protein
MFFTGHRSLPLSLIIPPGLCVHIHLSNVGATCVTDQTRQEAALASQVYVTAIWTKQMTFSSSGQQF